MFGPDPNTPQPITALPRLGFLKNYVDGQQIQVGDYTYYDEPDGPQRFIHNVLYHYLEHGNKLRIGKFCTLSKGVTFVMGSSNQTTNGFSRYPFYLFGHDWSNNATHPEPPEAVLPDTVIGNDVWIGHNVTIMPGVTIGNGAVIEALSVVHQDVPPYSIVSGNPAQVVSQRYSSPVSNYLLKLAWWDWPVEKITRHLSAITGNSLEALEKAHLAED